VQASHNQYDVGRDLASFQYDGVTDQLRLHVKKQLVRSRTRNLFVETALASKRAVSERAGQKQSRDALTNLELALDFDLFDRVLRGGYNEGQVRWVHGVEDFLGSMGQDDPDASRTSAGNNKADGDFDKLEFSLQRQQNIAAGSALVIRVNGQYSNDPLVSLEQFGLGGVASVRAYSGAEYMADKGVYAGLELRANAPGFAASEFYSGRSWGQSLQLSVFADYARGYKNAALGGEIEQISLSGVGVGLRLMPSNNLSLNVTLATPLGSTRPSGGKDPQLFVDLSYSF
jgi:hemolysin activation/secretion protein